MTEVDLVVAALAAGTSAGLMDTASAAVRDAYDALRAAVRRRLSPRGGQVLDAEEREPGVWETQLREELIASGADRDQELLAAVQEFRALVHSEGKYRIDARGAKGVLIGDHSTQFNTFN
ncbi:hypothetical protein [Streptomyces sp. SID9727]|uniref:hypothetical protein n=1 Tax=Streptomyces sp. SID9727 TaxID=2706114 RepID=UPI0013C7BE72|nr:hypothetical protein [Streptomyces sp. SID9727]NEC68882.1 hypothetical protein [Streptomyces sp. SID9727]